jgi:AcrR family transcriptional regulator
MSRQTTAKSARPRDAAATKALLLEAATEEFCEHGFAGARIDRIAERAGANKRLLYVYFGDKDRLFGAVLERQITVMAEAIPLTADDLPGYAAARFDHFLAHPRAARFAALCCFERAEPTDAERRSHRAKVDAIAAAQRAGTVDGSIPALDLYAMVLRIIESWLSAPPALAALAGEQARCQARLTEHRAALVEAVRRITSPR